jgi:hypothetical protein
MGLIEKIDSAEKLTKLIDTRGLAVLIVLLGLGFFNFRVWPLLERHVFGGNEEVYKKLSEENVALKAEIAKLKLKITEIPNLLFDQKMAVYSKELNEYLQKIKTDCDSDWVWLFRRENHGKFLDGGKQSYYTCSDEITVLPELKSKWQRQPDTFFPFHQKFLAKETYDADAKKIFFAYPNGNDWFSKTLSSESVSQTWFCPVYDSQTKTLFAVLGLGFYKREKIDLLAEHVLPKVHAVRVMEMLKNFSESNL